MQKALFIIFFLLGLSDIGMANYEVNENCKNARMLMMDLRIRDAKDLLNKELTIHPQNYYALYLEQTCDAFALLINGSKTDYETFLNNYAKKREIMDDHFVQSPYYLSCKAEMEMQAGMFNIIYGSQLSGVNKMYRAYKDVYNNLDKFPDFKPGKMLDGFFNIALENLPPFVKWVTSFFGVSSNFDYGINLLNSLYQSQKNIKGANAQTALFVIFAAKLNKTPEMVYNFTQTLDTNISHLFIFQYFKANIAYRTGKNDEALSILKQINYKARPEGEILYHYLMGKILLRKLDNKAGYHFEQYLNQLKKQEYYKEITYKLALYHLLQNDVTKFNALCKDVKNKGIDINERDREAIYDANLDYTPDVNLIKVRLLLDGGYFKQSHHFLESYDISLKNKLPYKLEYYFLKGRYEVSAGNNISAIEDYNTVINLGEDEDYYFACEAALRLGNIYEDSGNFEKAEEYYKLSIDLYDSDYYEYINDKAEKGLKRVKK